MLIVMVNVFLQMYQLSSIYNCVCVCVFVSKVTILIIVLLVSASYSMHRITVMLTVRVTIVNGAVAVVVVIVRLTNTSVHQYWFQPCSQPQFLVEKMSFTSLLSNTLMLICQYVTLSSPTLDLLPFTSPLFQFTALHKST